MKLDERDLNHAIKEMFIDYYTVVIWSMKGCLQTCRLSEVKMQTKQTL
jgi:hypothetical protein